MADQYQERYKKHQMRKAKTLAKLLKERHSTRVFADKEVDPSIFSLKGAPNSCNRQAIRGEYYFERDEKALLGGLLVGGVGWIHRAPLVILLFADPKAYKENLIYMPYLDAGVALYHLLLQAEDSGLKACYVNPQVREKHKKYFEDAFGTDIFCGAIGVGYEK